MSWTVDELKEWDDKIIEKAKEYGLDWYPINYEVCDYYSMIGHMSYHGLPTPTIVTGKLIIFLGF